MAQPNGGLQDSRSQAPSSASSSRLQRGIPSFKLSDDELARSKRFRNRVPSDGSRDGAGSNEGGGPTPTTTLEGTPAPGPRTFSSFTLASDVFRMSHNSSWGSGTGSNFFGFGLASVDGEGEDAVQRLDDATLNDLNFFTMEGIGPSDLPETAPRETSGPGLDMKPTDTRSSTDGGGPNRYSIESGGTHGGPRSNPLQSAVAKEEMVKPAIVDGTGSASNILRRASSSARDVLRSGSTSGRDSNRDFLEGNVFDLEGGLPTFSLAMEEYLNRQLEAAEHSLDDPVGDERAFGCMTTARDGGAGGGGGSGSSGGGTGAEGHLGVAGRAGASPIQNPTRSVVVKSECSRSRGASDEVLQGTTYSQCTQEEGGGLETKAAERRTRCKRGTQQQKKKRSKHEAKSESDEYADSSQSEYEPPTCTPREGKAKKGRGRRRGAAATTATRAAKTSSGSSGVRTASVSCAFLRRGSSLKRQTSEDVAARLPLEVLECFYHVPLNVAAQQLNVSLTMLKKLCRAYGVKRWPHRQVSSLDKTTSKLEDKIKARRDGGKDAPSLVRKLTQARKRRKVIIKTASAGLDASVLNSIFTCRPGDIDEDMLLSSTDVAKAVEKVQFRQDADHKGSGAESDSAAGDNSDSNSDSDDDDDVESYGPRANPPPPPPPPTAAKKTTRIRAVFAGTPAFSSKPPAVAKSVASPPPAFEPGGRSKSAATPRPGVEPGNKTAGNKPTSGTLGSGGKQCMKAARPAEPAKRTKGDASMTAKGRKGVTAAAARSMSSAGRRASFPLKKGTAATAAAAAAVAAAASPASLLSDSSSLNSPSGGSSANPTAACSPADPTSPVFSIGRPPHNRAPITSYSGVFGVGLHHAASSRVSSRGGDPTAFTRLRSVGGSSGQTPVSAQATAGECASSHVHQAARAPAWIGGGGGKRAKGSYGEWRGGALSLRSRPSQHHLSDAGSDSPTTTATLDSFDLKLSLESPPRGPPQASPPQPPPPPQPPLPRHAHHPYLLHHPLLHHHHHPSFHHLNWAAGGRYPGPPPPPPPPPQQQLYGCPIDTSFSPPQHGPGSRGFHAFSKVDDSREAAGTGAPRSAGDDASRPPDDKKSGGVSTGSTAAAAAAVAAAATATAAAGPAAAGPAPASSTSQDAEPRRTGFMSYLLHQAPQSPPLGPSSSPPAPPAPASPLATVAGGGGTSTVES